ncbi:MAG: serine protease [Candidatus Nitrosopolaris sp.]
MLDILTSQDIDHLFLAVARIATYDDPKTDTKLGYGTGFFYSNPNDQLFLLTNRHVILDEARGYIPNVVRLSLHTDPTNFRVSRNYDIPLYNGVKPVWKQPEPFADVVAIPLKRKDIEELRLILRYFTDANLLPEDYLLHIGEDIMVMGYPLGLYYDDVNNLPVVRNGIVASAYPVAYKGQPYFLIDATLHKGTSGSPVMTKFKRDWRTKAGSIMGDFQFFLLGINSSTAKLIDGEAPIGLNAAIFASIIQDITR